MPTRRPSRVFALAGLGLILLAGLGVGSLFVGSGTLSPTQVWSALHHASGSADATIVWDLRLPRIPVAIIAGASLGAAGALTQTLTRNPLAEPGLLGVNAGAALAVACGFLVSHTLSPVATVALAMAGAIVVGTAVLATGGVLTGRHSAVRLVLGGAALSAVTSAATNWLIISNPSAFTAFRHWDSGAVEARPAALVVVGAVLAVVAGVAIAFMVPALNALSLGSDMAGALGVNPRLVWAVAGSAAVAWCGVATALAGPISFLGLVAPLLVRHLTGPRIGPLLVGSALLGAFVLLAADVVGRVIVPPREVAAATVCGVLGAPAFVSVARRMRIAL